MRALYRKHRIVREVLENSTVKGSNLLVLVILAEASDWGNACMSVDELARLAKISDRQAKTCIDDLREAGHLTVVTPARGRGYPAVYHINPAPYFQTEAA